MVSGGTVRGDLSSIKSKLNQYTSEISSLDGTWKGPSHDNVLSNAEDFVSEYTSAIEGEMNAFASACDSYERYKNVKTNLEIAKRNYNQAVSNKDDAAISRFNSQISTYTNQLNSLKGDINSYLKTASAVKLSASPVPETLVRPTGSISYNENLILSSSGYVFPFAQGVNARITSHVGLRARPTAGASTNHRGTDIGVPTGTEVYSLADGVVINAGRGDAGSYGNWVRIRQDDGNIVTYGHVSRSDFYSVGDRVSAGDLVALTGNEGVSTGPHLHLQIEAESGQLLDSENFFADVWGL